MNSKIETYIGFAIKKGAIVFGCDSIKVSRKKFKLILRTKSLSNNSVCELENIADKRSCIIFIIDDYDLLKKRNCKALAVCDASLADAIIAELTRTKVCR